MPRGLFLIVAALLGAAAGPQASGIADPLAFVRARYAEYESGAIASVPLDTVASDRLRGLLHAHDEAAGGEEVGRIDFWVDGADWRITEVALTQSSARLPGRRSVTARFRNHGRPVTLHFHFVRERGAWRLDEVANHARRGGWTLTGLLRERP